MRAYKTSKMRDKYTLKLLGKACSNYRQYYLGKYQKEVAEELGITQTAISAFENGRTDSAILLLWYSNKGMSIDNIDLYLDKNFILSSREDLLKKRRYKRK